MSRRRFAAALRLLVAAIPLAAAASAAAQDTARKEVRIGLTYQPGTRPGVAVLPVGGTLGDSVRAILERDLDYGDRVELIGRAGTSAFDALQGSAGRPPNYALWKTLGAAALVQATARSGGVRVELHDVAQARVAQARDF